MPRSSRVCFIVLSSLGGRGRGQGAEGGGAVEHRHKNIKREKRIREVN